MKIEVDQSSCIIYSGSHRDVAFEIRGHNFKEKTDYFWDFKAMWATYHLLSEELHDKSKHKINSASWNGEQTYYRKEIVVFVDVPKDAEWAKIRPMYKVGDDFCHSWDDWHKGELSRDYLERHIKKVIDYFFDGPKEDQE